jgi:hypothetical protein
MPPQDTDSASAETAVVLAFLGRSVRLSPPELYAVVREPGATPRIIDTAVTHLMETGVILRDDDGALYASAALEHLDAIGLIGV